jgi:hypothetical protein
MKNVRILLVFVMMTLLIGCNNPSKKTKINSDDSIKDYLLKKDSIEKANAHPWKGGSFVDEFGDQTKEKFIQTQVEGYFSNSATSKSYLFAEILFKKDAAGIFLHQYNSSEPAQKFIGSVQIQMKNEIGQKLIINTSREWSKKGGTLIENWADINKYDFSVLRDFIKKSTGKIKVVIFDDYSGVFNFTIDATGFEQEFRKL